jgi:predicted protein tyrosine phosphatase
MKAISSKLRIKIPLTNDLSMSSKLLSDDKNLSKNECSHIIDNIYLSGCNFSLDYDFLVKNKFTHIVNCAAGSQRFKSPFYCEFSYLLLDIKDESGVEIFDYIQSVIEFLQNAGDDNRQRKILIHCFEGISRAPTILISYLIWKYSMDTESALKLVKEKRPCIEINMGFMCQLENFQRLGFEKKEMHICPQACAL